MAAGGLRWPVSFLEVCCSTREKRGVSQDRGDHDGFSFDSGGADDVPAGRSGPGGRQSAMGVRCEPSEEEIVRGGRKGGDGGARPL
jgi:hypothetical protein